MDSKIIKDFLENKTKISIIQAENPDGDSLGSALGLAEILENLGKKVSLFCPVEIPKYLRYFKGWDLIDMNFDFAAEAYIIVDTASSILLSKILNDPAQKNCLFTKPVLVIDHHIDAIPDLAFDHEMILADFPAAGELIFNLSSDNNWQISNLAAENLLAAILSDTLGLSTPNVKAESFINVAKLTELGAKTSVIEDRRREFMKKAPEILKYKGELIERIEYFLDGELALVHIPWEEIRKYSDKYNPSVLVIDEMRLVENVKIAVALKTYPDGKLTGKIRTNSPIAADIAGFFGGGGHAYAAGFRIYEDYDNTVKELLTACEKALKQEK